MDKYEFNLKVEQLNKLVKSGDYKAAMRITDTIDWSRVHNAGLLTTVSEVYEKNDEYKEAREILLLAYDRAPVGKRALYRLAMLAIKEGDIAEAEAYYREYIEISPQDSRKYLMEYHIAVAQGNDINKKIKILEKYNDIEKMDEQWKYELALLYAQTGRIDDCIKVCDEIMLLFGVGEYVEKAAALKESTGCPLSSKQQEQVDNKEYYEDRLNTLAKRYESGERENYPNLNLDDMSAYKPREDKKTTISLGDEEEPDENAPISTELFPKSIGVNEVRISETTFKGESVNPEFEVELKRAIAITNENLSKMKGERDLSSMREIDEEVRAHMERVERIKHGRFISPPVMAERRKTRISNYFDSMGLPKAHYNGDELDNIYQNIQISEEQEDVVKEEENSFENIPDYTIDKEFIPEDVQIEEDTSQDELSPEDINSPQTTGFILKKDEPEGGSEELENNEPDNSDIPTEELEEIPKENITVTETASTKVLENYVPEKKIPIFDKDDLINSYFDDEADMGVPTVSAVMAKRKEQRDLVQSSVKSETKMEVIDDEEVYYTREERTFVTKVKRGEEPEEIFIEPEFKNHEDEEIKTASIVEEDIDEQIKESDVDNSKTVNPVVDTLNDSQDKKEFSQESLELFSDEDVENDTVVIEESTEEVLDDNREVDLPVHGKVMKAKAPKSREPKEYLMRRPGSIMVEGITEQKALENAIEVLREVNELTKIKHSVLKIRAKSLNSKGVMNSIDKIKGKDLIIVEAGDLDDNTIAELIEFIRDGKETVVFADTISGISSLIEANDLLHGMSLVMREEEVPVKRKNIVANIELKDRDKDREEAQDKKDAEEIKEPDKEEKDEAAKASNLMDLEVIANILKQENDNENLQFEIKPIGGGDTIKLYSPEESEEEDGEDKGSKEEEEKGIELNPVISEPKKPELIVSEPVEIEKREEIEEEDRGEPGEDSIPLSVDDFIAYALNYAKDIECLLSNKARYAVEERADYMKEDGTPLTKRNARNLIDHAADLAEKPGVMKALLGFMTSKYDKEGRLILREEHFRI